MKESTINDLLTLPQLMDWLDLSRGTIYRLRKEGTFKAYKLAGKLYFKRSEILEAIEANEETTEQLNEEAIKETN